MILRKLWLSIGEIKMYKSEKTYGYLDIFLGSLGVGAVTVILSLIIGCYLLYSLIGGFFAFLLTLISGIRNFNK